MRILLFSRFISRFLPFSYLNPQKQILYIFYNLPFRH